ncbi:MAG: DNA-processing protein DprA [Aminobacterium sp.]|jgi:DNA processing protein|uniref:DNA-processing protein DprA n=1 Tax=unclassified Aminobacterium TaxID=2685012 RepID=UPI001BCF3FBF|nr:MULTISPECIES: DNA-processing protein DprA [unclassified Aminobacterium]MDD2207051.1 DNA-processing protein DprA [Aminobacterium sp.]MDD3425579.1 DNA-processing protein DprA [Aminobacterium sp.]MDD3708323.1 DNA-processing protein DprA [Aminobacterium sp.]MDD4228754.1 DNA-processing protein DprA [Aminobacterium sp.]MDD4550627.1 DNA-processing protein DprA [Aminobacterium sp.]
MTPRQEALLLINAIEADRRLWDKIADSEEKIETIRNGFLTDEQKKSLTSRTYKRLVYLVHSQWAEKERYRCESVGVQLLFMGESGYPKKLEKMENAPLVLYVRGNYSFKKPILSVVGTRRSTYYGQQVARALGRVAADKNWTLLSGGALGIDGAAHSGSLDAGGETAVVLAHGLDHVYPKQHEELFRNILSSGALVTEYGLGISAKPWHFPKRNRIIAGLADKIVIVEAPKRSGAIVTAQIALDIGREIWVVPGRIDEKICSGSNKLLYDGAHPLVDLADFAETLSPITQLHLLNSKKEKSKSLCPNISEKEQKILNLIQNHGDQTVDNLTAQGKMTAADVISCVSHLSALDLIYSSGPGRFRASIESK